MPAPAANGTPDPEPTTGTASKVPSKTAVPDAITRCIDAQLKLAAAQAEHTSAAEALGAVLPKREWACFAFQGKSYSLTKYTSRDGEARVDWTFEPMKVVSY